MSNDIKHVFQSLTINSALLGLLASSAGVAASPNFWGKAANCAENFNVPGLATGLREMIPVVTGMASMGSIAGRLRKGGIAFWTPPGLPGPNREDFKVKSGPDIATQLEEVKLHATTHNQNLNQIMSVVEGLKQKVDQSPGIDQVQQAIASVLVEKGFVQGITQETVQNSQVALPSVDIDLGISPRISDCVARTGGFNPEEVI